MGREVGEAREVEAELKAAEYAHLHPETDYPRAHRPGVLHRLVDMLRGKHSPE